MGFSIIRMVRGPRAQDRVVALDALYVNAMILLLTIGVRTGSVLYVEAGLIIALLGLGQMAIHIGWANEYGEDGKLIQRE